MENTRRDFMKKSALATAGLGLFPYLNSSSAFAAQPVAPSDTVRIALIGARNHGYNVLDKHMNIPGVQCVALCDIDDSVLDKRSADVEAKLGKRPKVYKDYRRMLEDKDIDAVIIGTPDHWHCLQTVASLEAGKDVYVEKPLANSIEECNIIARATRRYGKIVQVGQQQRSGAHWQAVMDYVKSGKLGKIRKIQVWGNFAYGIGRSIVPDEPVPAGVDFDMWLGPAPARSFNASRFHGSWRMFWDYGGGLLSDWGVHLLDMALWSMDVNYLPKSVYATGGNLSFPDNARETFDTMSVNYEMDGFCMAWDHVAGIGSGPYDRMYGLAWIGDNGTLVADRAGWEVRPEWDNNTSSFKMEKLEDKSGGENHQEHAKNFIECIKSRKEPACPVEVGRDVAIYAHLGNISLRAGNKVNYDAVKAKITNDSMANSLVVPKYRNPWKLPKY